LTPEERVAAMPVYYLRIDLKEPRVIDVPDLVKNSHEIVKVIRAAVAEEREACARIADGLAYIGMIEGHADDAKTIAAAIRAR